MYLVIDKDGKPLTKPIKASAFHNKPTLNHIESKFKNNEQKREPDKKHIKTAVDWAMQAKPETLNELAKALQKDRIELVVRRNEQGRVYGMTYVDHEKKTVFNGSDLGKEYSAKRMLECLKQQPSLVQEKMQQLKAENDKQQTPAKEQDKEVVRNEELSKGISKMIDQVVEPDAGNNGAFNKDLLKEEQRRKKRNQQSQEL